MILCQTSHNNTKALYKFVTIIVCERQVRMNGHKTQDFLYGCEERSRFVEPEVGRGGGVGLGKWERLLEDADDARVRKTISWKGDLEVL